jgi:uracil-DNA glycosylase family 4
VAQDSLARVGRDIVACERCRRLRRWCEDVADVRVKRFRDQEYWGRPVPGFGDPRARLLIVGLAPGAHGANRTGRVFTGDRSGDFLFAALHRAGFASQPASISRNDGLTLRDCYIAPLARCAPPANKPTPAELDHCKEYLLREWRLLRGVRAVLALGKMAMDGAVALFRGCGLLPSRPALSFGHGIEHRIGDGLILFTSYHPSQQNTFTGKLTPAGFDAVMHRIRLHLDGPVISRSVS